MKSKQLRSLYAVQEKLRADSFLIYKRVMHELFQHHEDRDYVRTLAGYFRSQRYDLALKLADSLSEQQYSDATDHFVANQFALLIKKYPWKSSVVKTDPESVAIRKFFSSEHKCKRLNKKFNLYDNFRSPYESYLHKVRSVIQYTIGLSPPLENILSNSAFGAGASLGVHGDATSLVRKILSDKWTVSPGAYTIGYLAVCMDPNLRDVLLEEKGRISCYDWSVAKARYAFKAKIVTNNKIAFVPKTAKTHRAIAVEPLLNGFVQKGIDIFMRKCLKRIGIDLSDQSLNQRMARQGSLSDSGDPFVTIDLSSASDNISIGLVKSLIPPDWFDLLNQARSHQFEFGGKLYTYSKFCSMGNGFCFPLETLIFTAISQACGCGKPGTDFSVYGDDIIVRKSKSVQVLKLLRVCGFSPNVNKTFLEGPFRESCGSDWFGGIDVRPYTLDYELNSLESLFKWLNLTRRSTLTSDFFRETYDIILSYIPDRYQFFRPFRGNADSGIDCWADQHLTSRNCYFDRRQQIWFCRELTHRPIRDMRFGLEAYRRDSVDMYALLSGVRSERYKVAYTFRRKTKTAITFTGYSGATSMWLPIIQG
jgi:hypothetical protein